MIHDNKITTELKENEVLYFLHIPKTAGITLTSMIDDYFDLNLICGRQTWDDLLLNIPKNLSRYKSFRGHFGFSLHRIISKTPVCITMLRDPIERTISDFEHYRRTPGPIVIDFFCKSSNISDFLSDPRYKPFLTNTQTRFIALDLDVPKIANSYVEKNHDDFLFLPCREFLSPTMSDEEMINEAKTNISKFRFIGLVERFEESLFLLCYTFGWKPIFNIRKLNVAPANTKNLSPETLEKIKQCNRLDVELYQYSKQIFESRYSQMIKDLKENYYEERFSNMSFSKMMYELLEKHYEKCLQQTKIKLSTSIEYDFRQRFTGSGWYYRENYNASGIIFRWTGPDTTSVIDLPLAKDKDLQIEFRVLMCLSENILQSLNLHVNDYPVDIRILYCNEGRTIFTGVIPKSVLQNEKPYTRLAFNVSHTISPNSIDPSSNDMRLLGVAIDYIKIFPSEK